MYRTILLATDGSARARRAMKAAVRMARDWDSRLIALNVRPTYASLLVTTSDLPVVPSKRVFDRATRQASQAVLEEVRRYARAQRVAAELLSVADASPAHAIVHDAKRKRADLIVMASHGRGRLARLLLGSTTQRVLAACRIPVLVHR